MVCRRPGAKPLCELMMTHICVTRPHWVKWYLHRLLLCYHDRYPDLSDLFLISNSPFYIKNFGLLYSTEIVLTLSSYVPTTYIYRIYLCFISNLTLCQNIKFAYITHQTVCIQLRSTDSPIKEITDMMESIAMVLHLCCCSNFYDRLEKWLQCWMFSFQICAVVHSHGFAFVLLF